MRIRLILIACVTALPLLASADFDDDDGKPALLEGISEIQVRVFVRDYASPPVDPTGLEQELKRHVERALVGGGVPVSDTDEPPRAVLQVNVDSRRLADECMLTASLHVLEQAYLVRNGRPAVARTWGLPRVTTTCAPTAETAPGLLDRIVPRFVADYRSSHPVPAAEEAPK